MTTAVAPHRSSQLAIRGALMGVVCVVEAIGHELQHAVEVLHERRIRSDRQIYTFFYMLGHTASERFETDEAIEAGFAVARAACRGVEPECVKTTKRP